MTPTDIKLHQKSRVLEVVFDNQHFNLPYEYLRVFSPSAEVRGHGNEPMKLVLNKQDVTIKQVIPAGHYAIKIVFDDGHDSGIYTWEFLYELGQDYDKNWAMYQNNVRQHDSGIGVFDPNVEN